MSHSPSPRLQERLVVERDGEELTVYNWVNVDQPAVVRGHNPVVQKFDTDIGAGDSDMHPDYVTEWVADELWDEFYIDVEDHEIEVVDVESEEVTVL